ncbi:MAG: efflux RND transporter periplasmic adaptor subunit [Nitrospirae bacterium]|nr:efflux RND transporter periplasmic adaptor subunit [Nitrospirota bacterium]
MSISSFYSEHKRFALVSIAAVAALLSAEGGTGMLCTTTACAAATQETKPPSLVRQGDKYLIPEGCLLRTRLVVEPVAVKNTPHTMTLPGSVEADPARTNNILTPVAGKVARLMISLGDRVSKGQPLAMIESADLAQAYADYDKASDNMEHAKRTLERARGLNKAGAGAVKDLEQAESDFEQATFELRRAEARLKEIGVPITHKDGPRLLTLTAPTSGSVTALSAAQGAFVNDVTAPLMTIANLDSVWVTAYVPETSISYVTKGQPVDVSFSAYPSQVFHATVSFVNDVVEPDTRRNKVRIAFPNPDRKFKPNMFANVSFKIPQKPAVYVPNSALLMNNDNTAVFLEVAPWTFVKRTVVPGFGEGDGARIDQGLSPGDRVIVKGGVLMND